MADDVTIDRRGLDALIRDLQTVEGPMAADAAQAILGVAQTYVDVATGAARDSLYVLGGGVDTYSAAAGAAQADDPTADIVDKVDPPPDGSAVLASAVGHALYLELGTTKMAAHPFLNPAVEASGDAVQTAVDAHIKGLIHE